MRLGIPPMASIDTYKPNACNNAVSDTQRLHDGLNLGHSRDMVQIRVDSSGAAGAAATREFPIHLTRTVNTFPGAK